MHIFTAPRFKLASPRPPVYPAGGRAGRHMLDRIAILNNADHVKGSRTSLTALLADHWRATGIEVIELAGTSLFVEADLLFLNLGCPVVPEDYRRFAAQYPVTFNTRAGDLCKHLHADGQLSSGPVCNGPVLIKADADDASPHRQSARRMRLPGERAPSRPATPANTSSRGANDNTRIYPSLQDVPPDLTVAAHVIEKLLPQQQRGHAILRQYYFLGNTHFLSTLTPGASQFVTSAPPGLEEWTPCKDLLDLRAQLGLDYGCIDFEGSDGKPLVISVSCAPALPVSADGGYVPAAFNRLAEALAEAMVDRYTMMEKAVF